MKKDEMEQHWQEYDGLLQAARQALRLGSYREALELALASREHIDGMMQYRRKYHKEQLDGIETIDIVLKYAPMLLDFPSLDQLEALLKNQRRIDKNTNEDLAAKLSLARTKLWDAHRLWDRLEQQGPIMQDEVRMLLGGQQDWWRMLAESWESMGLLHRTNVGRSYRLDLATRMGEIVTGKCPRCGDCTEAPKALLLEELQCPSCQQSVVFVLMRKQAVSMKD